MHRRSATLTLATTSMVGLLLGMTASTTSSAAPFSAQEPDGHDHHRRPAEYDDPTLVVPPASGAPSDYPRAAGFVPADPSNYTANGMSTVQYVVVHTIQGSYAGAISWFQNPISNVSAHYCMRSSDGEVTQMVHHDDRAWHVGNSNSVSLGIEHEGFVDDPTWYTWVMYVESARLARFLADEHGLPLDRDHIVGHVELPNQTHTDPGPNWDWDLYMALIHDVVPQGEITGVVVDRSRACMVTANTDTWLKATPEPSDTLTDEQRCWVPAGTELTVLYDEGDFIGHRRLVLDEGSPCAAELGGRGYAFGMHVDGTCDPADAAAKGVQVSLDGGAAVGVDAEGRFTSTGVAEGEHAIDVTGEGYEVALATVALEVYPGARVVIAVDPVADPTGGDETGGGLDETGGSGSDGEPGTTGDAEGSGGLPGGTAGTGDDGYDPALPQGLGEDEDGCACRSQPGSQTGRGRSGFVMLGLFGLVGLLRRRRTF